MGCTELEPGEDTCISAGRCTPPDDLFRCLPDGEPPFVPLSPPPPLVNYIVPIVDSTVPNPAVALPNLRIRVCLDSDQVCDPASPMALPAIVSPVPGQPAAVTSVLLPFVPMATLHLRLSAMGYMDARYYFGGPLIGAPTPDNPEGGDTFQFQVPEQAAPLLGVPAGTSLTIPIVRGQPIAMIPLERLEQFFRDIAVGQTRDPNAGIIALRMIDCDMKRTPGVNLDMAAELGAAFGFVVQTNNVPVPSFPSDLAGPTVPGERGGAGFANLAPRNYSPVGVLPDGRTYGGLVGFNIAPNTITYGEVRPGSDEGYPYGR